MVALRLLEGWPIEYALIHPKACKKGGQRVNTTAISFRTRLNSLSFGTGCVSLAYMMAPDFLCQGCESSRAEVLCYCKPFGVPPTLFVTPDLGVWTSGLGPWGYLGVT